MTKQISEQKPLPTIWHTLDELWEKIEPILAEYDPPKSTGRSRVDQRAALDAIIFRLRTSCQWDPLPKEFPEDSSVHRTFQRWIELGVLDRIWSRSARTKRTSFSEVSWQAGSELPRTPVLGTSVNKSKRKRRDRLGSMIPWW